MVKVPIVLGPDESVKNIIGYLEISESKNVIDLLAYGEMIFAPTFRREKDNSLTLISVSLIGKRMGITTITNDAPTNSP